MLHSESKEREAEMVKVEPELIGNIMEANGGLWARRCVNLSYKLGRK